MAFSTSHLAGVDLESSYPSIGAAPFAVGTVVDLSDGGKAVFVKAISTVAQYDVVGILGDSTAVPLTTTNSATTKRVAVAQVAIASNAFGWVQVGGRPRAKLAANCAPNVPLYTTATGGVLDDAVVSTGLVLGTIAETSISNATAVTVLMATGAMVGSGDMD